jgi:amino acid transporter
MSYDWWGTAVVFFAMISNIFVNIGCTAYFYRFRRRSFRLVWHGVIPLLGILTSLLPLFYSFGPDLWASGWKKGQSVMLFCVLVTMLSILYTFALHKWRPHVFRRTTAITLE